MKYILLLLLALSVGCDRVVEVDVQINPYVCVDGYRWSLDGEPIVDSYGQQEECE